MCRIWPAAVPPAPGQPPASRSGAESGLHSACPQALTGGCRRHDHQPRGGCCRHHPPPATRRPPPPRPPSHRGQPPGGHRRGAGVPRCETVEAGPASDIFSLGAVLTFAAVGEGPFGAGAATELLYRVVHDLPDTRQLPARSAPWSSAAWPRIRGGGPPPTSSSATWAPSTPGRTGCPRRSLRRSLDSPSPCPPGNRRPLSRPRGNPPRRHPPRRHPPRSNPQ
jgi:hypothetical protein